MANYKIVLETPIPSGVTSRLYTITNNTKDWLLAKKDVESQDIPIGPTDTVIYLSLELGSEWTIKIYYLNAGGRRSMYSAVTYSATDTTPPDQPGTMSFVDSGHTDIIDSAGTELNGIINVNITIPGMNDYDEVTKRTLKVVNDVSHATHYVKSIFGDDLKKFTWSAGMIASQSHTITLVDEDQFANKSTARTQTHTPPANASPPQPDDIGPSQTGQDTSGGELRIVCQCLLPVTPVGVSPQNVDHQKLYVCQGDFVLQTYSPAINTSAIQTVSNIKLQPGILYTFVLVYYNSAGETDTNSSPKRKHTFTPTDTVAPTQPAALTITPKKIYTGGLGTTIYVDVSTSAVVATDFTTRRKVETYAGDDATGTKIRTDNLEPNVNLVNIPLDGPHPKHYAFLWTDSDAAGNNALRLGTYVTDATIFPVTPGVHTIQAVPPSLGHTIPPGPKIE